MFDLAARTCKEEKCKALRGTRQQRPLLFFPMLFDDDHSSHGRRFFSLLLYSSLPAPFPSLSRDSCTISSQLEHPLVSLYLKGVRESDLEKESERKKGSTKISSDKTMDPSSPPAAAAAAAAAARSLSSPSLSLFLSPLLTTGAGAAISTRLSSSGRQEEARGDAVKKQAKRGARDRAEKQSEAREQARARERETKTGKNEEGKQKPVDDFHAPLSWALSLSLSLSPHSRFLPFQPSAPTKTLHQL